MLQWEHSAILSTFIKLPFVIQTFVLSSFEKPFYTGFTEQLNIVRDSETLKIRARSPIPNQVFIMSKCYIQSNLVPICTLVHEISYTQESATATMANADRVCTKTDMPPSPLVGGHTVKPV